MKNIEENNKLIAEFMSMRTGRNFKLIGDKVNLTVIDRKKTVCEAYELRFNISWDWLMPVVEKIETLENKDGYCYIVNNQFALTKIQADQDIIVELTAIDKKMSIYKAVVEFIKWYNQQEK